MTTPSGIPNRKQRRAAASDFSRALALHRSGRLAEAERIWRGFANFWREVAKQRSQLLSFFAIDRFGHFAGLTQAATR
jgi:hypothetical protein